VVVGIWRIGIVRVGDKSRQFEPVDFGAMEHTFPTSSSFLTRLLPPMLFNSMIDNTEEFVKITRGTDDMMQEEMDEPNTDDAMLMQEEMDEPNTDDAMLMQEEMDEPNTDDELRVTEEVVKEIQLLNSLFTQKVCFLRDLILVLHMWDIKVIEQSEGIEGIHTTAVATKEDLNAGNKLLEVGMWGGSQRLSACALVMLGLFLLLLDA